LHKIDIEKLWQALQESKPTGSLVGQLVELTAFCQKNLTTFGLIEQRNDKK
jgi:hypothetical protein